MNYSDVVAAFEEAGFIYVTTEIKYDITTGWFKDEGEVEAVVIGDENSFDSGNSFRPDEPVIVTYHALKER